MKKFLSFAVFVLVLCSLSVAQTTAPKKVLTAKDIDIFVAKYPAIEADFEALGDKYDDLLDTDIGDPSLGSFGAAIAQARATKVPAEIAAILKKHGLGENGFEKIMVISFGFVSLEMENVVKEQVNAPGMTSEMKSYMDGALMQVNEMKASIHKDDLALIASKRAGIAEVLGEDME